MKPFLLSTVFVLGLGASIASAAEAVVEVTPTKDSHELREPPMGALDHNRPHPRRDSERPRGPSGANPEHASHSHEGGHRGPPHGFFKDRFQGPPPKHSFEHSSNKASEMPPDAAKDGSSGSPAAIGASLVPSAQ